MYKNDCVIDSGSVTWMAIISVTVAMIHWVRDEVSFFVLFSWTIIHHEYEALFFGSSF